MEDTEIARMVKKAIEEAKGNADEDFTKLKITITMDFEFSK